MTAREVRPGLTWVGAIDWERRLFDSLIPTPQGTTYNAYLLKGSQRTVLLDTVDATCLPALLDHLHGVDRVDDIVIHHVEQDHSGSLPFVMERYPEARVLISPKGREMLLDHLRVDAGRVETVEDGATLDVGGRTLRFLLAPWQHWPETMMTYEETEGVLFSCDAFGGYGALRGAIFDDECTDPEFYRREALRYYANIVAVFSRAVLQAIDKLAGVPVSVVAPSHGLIWRERPGEIIDLYRQWARYATEPAEPGVTLIYGSMYGNTERMMNAVAQGISHEGLPLQIFDVTRTHVSYILPSLWVYRGVMIGAPTYEGALFPPMAHVLDMAAQKRVRDRMAARFGSYGWSGGAQRHLERVLEGLKWQLAESFEFVGGPTEEDLKHGEEFGARFARLVAAG